VKNVNFINDIIDTALSFDASEQTMAIVMSSVFLLSLAMRIALFLSYRGSMALVNHASKNIKTKDDIAKLPKGALAGPLPRAAREYAAMTEKGVKIDTLELARMDVLRNHLLIFNFKSMERFIHGLERAFLPFSFLFVLAAEARMEFVVLSAVVYLFMRISAAIVDIEAAYERYISTLSHTLSRDIGRFFPSDTSAAIYTFGSDLKTYLNRQAGMFSDVLNKINSEFTGAISNNITTMAKGLDATLNAISKQEALDGAITKWTAAIDKASELQKVTGAASEKTEAAVSGLAATLQTAGSDISLYSKTMKEGRNELKEDMGRLSKAIEKLNGLSANVGLHSEAVSDELKLVREYQKVLEMSVAQYETSMKDLTAKMGDALGKIIAYHLDASSDSISNSIADSLKQVIAKNTEHAEQIRNIFQEIQEQSKYQTQLLLRIINND